MKTSARLILRVPPDTIDEIPPLAQIIGLNDMDMYEQSGTILFNEASCSLQASTKA